MKYFLQCKQFLFVVFIIITVFWILFIPGPRVANDYPYVFKSYLELDFGIPQIWNRWGTNFGEYAVSNLWSWPLDLFNAFGSKLGLPFTILERLLGITPFVLIGAYSIRKLLKYFKIHTLATVITSIFYLLNTYILLIIDGGQLRISLAYAWFPLAYLATISSYEKRFQCKILAGLAVSLLGFLDIRFIYVLGILILIHLVYNIFFVKKYKAFIWVFEWIKIGIFIFLILTGLNFYWLLPSILVRAPVLPENYSQVSQTSFLGFTTWKHSLLLLQPNWYKNVFGVVPPINYAFILIPFLAFLAPIMAFVKKTKNLKEVMFWTIVAMVGIFLTKGSNPPFGEIYNFLFTKLPGFSLFRDSTKFFFLIALSYSLLIAFSTDFIIQMLLGIKIKSKFLKSCILNPKSFIIFLTLYLIILVSPVWTGKMTGMFSKPVYEKESFTVSDIIEKDKEFSRIFYIPSRAPLGYASPLHPSVEAIRMLLKRPFEIGVVGSYEQFNYLREAPFMGELFAISGIKYLYYPFPDTRREVLKQDNINYYFAFLDQLSNLPWVEKQISDPPVAVLQTKKTNDHFFIAPNTDFIIGSDRIYSDLVNIPDFSLSENALIFAEERPSILNNLSNIPLSNIILYDKNETDLAASFIDKNLMIIPAQDLARDPTKDNPWWKRETGDFLWWRIFLQTKYGIDNQDFDFQAGWAIAEGNLQLTINDSRFAKGKILLARVMKSSRGGKVEFWQGNKKIGEINTLNSNPENIDIKLTGYGDIPDKISTYDKADFNWYEVGKLVFDKQSLTIKTFGDINVVNVVSALSDQEWNRVNRITSEYNILNWSKLSDNDKKRLIQGNNEAKISYNRLSPTQYKVKIEGLKQPATLAFSETYDSFWQANGAGSYPIYSLINGFRLDEDGVYDIYFSPQKYVLPGLVISITTLIVVIGILAYLKLRKKL